jgi:hypothetical protein
MNEMRARPPYNVAMNALDLAAHGPDLATFLPFDPAGLLVNNTGLDGPELIEAVERAISHVGAGRDPSLRSG